MLGKDLEFFPTKSCSCKYLKWREWGRSNLISSCWNDGNLSSIGRSWKDWIPVLYHSQNVVSERERANKWFAITGAQSDPKCHPKYFLIEDQILNECETVGLFTEHEYAVGKAEKCRVGKQVKEQHFFSIWSQVGIWSWGQKESARKLHAH